jgi:spore coat protein CotH
MQEKLGDDYLASHYHIPKKNITTIKNTLGEGDAAVYQSYFDFYDWAKGADFTDAGNYSRFCEMIDVQSMIDWIAAESIICNWDSLIHVNNTMIWRANKTDASNPYADGRWRFLLYADG